MNKVTKLLILFATGFAMALLHLTTMATPSIANQQNIAQVLYKTGRFSEATEILEQEARLYANQGDSLREAISLSNLSLAYQKLGMWSEAEVAIEQSLTLSQQDNSTSAVRITAQTLNRQGSLEFSQGKAQQALETWERAAQVYREIADEEGIIRTQINQAQALQVLGFYRRALQVLHEAEEDLAAQPDSLTKVAALRSLGDVLQLVGDRDQSLVFLEESLTLARKLKSSEHISAALFSLGNHARTQQEVDKAIDFYRQATALSPAQNITIQAQLNRLRLLEENGNESAAQSLIKQILPQIELLPQGRDAVSARVNLAKILINLQSDSPNPPKSQFPHPFLAKAVQQARKLSDKRMEAYALGTLGQLYEENRQWSEAQQLTQQALVLSETIQAPELTYLWQWQLGRLLKVQGDEEGAIAAYETAIDLLKSLRSDLVAINADVQFSFRESVEPVYRELVGLLLDADNKKSSPKNIEKARRLMESLQLAELDNFFRSACLTANPLPLEKIDHQAAVIYPIILPDRLEVILSIPGQTLRHYSTEIKQEQINSNLRKLRRSVTNRLRWNDLSLVEELYDWLIRPAEEELAQSKVETIVFVLDGELRNLPMAALYDGEKYLAEKYALAVAPGLDLLESKPLKFEQLNVLTAGLSEPRQGFNQLPGVQYELEQIKSQVKSSVLLNQEFTEDNVQELISDIPFPVVHLATHGKFSSQAEETFILTWNDKINVNELSNLLKTQELGRSQPIELLVFSACETANGDSRAALGIAGVAVRAGARSTMASLWSVDDEATSKLMTHFYQELAKPETTKAEALRRAQVFILNQPKYRQHPYYWAPFIMVGNWL